MVVALGLVAVQAALGGVTVLQGNSPLSVAAHLSVALVFLATLILVFLFTERRTGLNASVDVVGLGTHSLAGMALLATLVTVANGAVTAKSGASFACESWPMCEGWGFPDLADPLVRLHFGHRLLALATAALVTLLYVAARQRRSDTVRFHRDTRLAFRLVLLEVVAGAVVVLTGVPLWGRRGSPGHRHVGFRVARLHRPAAICPAPPLWPWLTHRMTDTMAYAELEQRFKRLGVLQGAAGVLGWDRQTMMPPGGAGDRAEQSAALALICHELLADPAAGEQLDRAEADEAAGLDPWQAANLARDAAALDSRQRTRGGSRRGPG